MLQKLSKYEVKVLTLLKLVILLPLRFYVKSNYGEFKWSKNVIFSNLEVLKFDFSKFEQFLSSKFTKYSKFRVSNNSKNDIFGPFEFTNI